MARHMHLAGFLIAGPVVHSHALWRLGNSSKPEFLDFAHYAHIAKTLERGLFDLVFFADRLAVSNRYGQSHHFGAQHGDQDSTRLDPIPILSAMSAVTTHLGLGATRSTTYAQPYSLAREFATLDHISNGRAAWNVVTSVNRGEAENFGLTEHLDHDARYDRADEFMDITRKLWEGWEEGALVMDRAEGIYADPSRIHAANYEGKYFRCKGPLNIPRSPQGGPVIIQAGSSARGQDFAARWSEVVFSIQPDLGRMQKFYRDIKSRTEKFGRSPSSLKVLTAVMPFIAATEKQAVELRDAHNELVQPLVGLATLSSHMNIDFSQYPTDLPISDLKVDGMQGLFSLIRNLSKERSLTLHDVGRLYGQSIMVPQVAGTPGQVADWMEDKFNQEGCDGFVISPSQLPEAFDAFVDQVVPELQARRLMRTRYEGATLRERLFSA